MSRWSVRQRRYTDITTILFPELLIRWPDFKSPQHLLLAFATFAHCPPLNRPSGFPILLVRKPPLDGFTSFFEVPCSSARHDCRPPCSTHTILVSSTTASPKRLFDAAPQQRNMCTTQEQTKCEERCSLTPLCWINYRPAVLVRLFTAGFTYPSNITALTSGVHATGCDRAEDMYHRETDASILSWKSYSSWSAVMIQHLAIGFFFSGHRIGNFEPARCRWSRCIPWEPRK